MTHPFRKTDLLLVVGLCFLCFFWRLGAVGLFDFNEGLYTQAAREMFLRGDYVTPRVNGLFFFDKPPLALWCCALSFAAFGVNEFAARFPVAVAASLMTLLTFWFGARYLGRRAGLLAAAMVALNPLVLGTARQMTMDIHQSWWVAFAMVCYFLGYTASSARGKRWYYGFWAGIGMAVLAKSVPGLLPLIVAFVFVLIDERFQARAVMRRIWEAKLLLGVPLMLAIVAPWFILVEKANGPVFYQQFFLFHHVKLLNGTEFNHAEPFWKYAPYLLIGFFPWSFFLPWAIPDLWMRARHGDSGEIEGARARRFVLVWAIVPFVLFSLMTSKLVSYLLPMYPAAALVAGDWMSRALEEKRIRGLRPGAAILAVLASAVALGVWLYLRSIAGTPLAEKLHEAAPPAVITYGLTALTGMAVGMVVAAALVSSGRRRAGAVALVATMAALALLTIEQGLRAMEETVNAPLQTLAREAGAQLAAGTPLAIHIAGPVRPSVFFYLPARAFLGRLPYGGAEDGIILERGEKEPVDKFLQTHRPAYVLTDRKRADALLATTPDLEVADRRDRWVLLRAEPVSSAAAHVRRVQ